MKFLAAVFTAMFMFANVVMAAEFPAQVKTAEGVVQGAYDDSYGIVKWLGIPYAQQADGDNRYELPQKAQKHSQVLDCTKPAPANLQFNGKTVVGSEGVLTLDVYRPDTKEKICRCWYFCTAAIIRLATA